MDILGIDIGGSGIKGAPVNTDTGVLRAERYRIPTPEFFLPDSVGEIIGQIVQHFDWQGPIGCTFPSVIKRGVIYTAANINKSWLGVNGEQLISQKTGGRPVALLNDADAAGIAEMTFGAGKGHTGVVIMLTFGTGIGSAIFTEGKLLPNTEFGHLEIRGKEAEHRASDAVRSKEDLNWKKWAERVNEVIDRMEALFFPDLLIIGGGVSKKHEKFLPLLKTRAEIVPAKLLNEAGIVGAALVASQRLNERELAQA